MQYFTSIPNATAPVLGRWIPRRIQKLNRREHRVKSQNVRSITATQDTGLLDYRRIVSASRTYHQKAPASGSLVDYQLTVRPNSVADPDSASRICGRRWTLRSSSASAYSLLEASIRPSPKT